MGCDDLDWYEAGDPAARVARAFFEPTRSIDRPNTIDVRVDYLGYERKSVPVTPRSASDPDFLRAEKVLLKALAPSARLVIRCTLGGNPVLEPLRLMISEGKRKLWAKFVSEPDATEGTHKIDLPAGNYLLQIMGTAAFPTLDDVPRPIDLRPGETQETVARLVAGVLALRVRGPSGVPLDGALVEITSNSQHARAWVVSKPDTALVADLANNPGLRSGKPGEYRLLLRPGSYRLRVAAVGLNSLEFGNVTVAEDSETSLGADMERAR